VHCVQWRGLGILAPNLGIKGINSGRGSYYHLCECRLDKLARRLNKSVGCGDTCHEGGSEALFIFMGKLLVLQGTSEPRP